MRHRQESLYAYYSKNECNVGLPTCNSAQHGYWVLFTPPPDFMYIQNEIISDNLTYPRY